MRPIAKRLLVNSATVYNAWKDPETGDLTAYRTVLRNVRIMAASKRYDPDRISGVVKSSLDFLYDRVNSSADGGKTWLAPDDWERADDKEAHWTLRETDWVLAVPGRLENVAPEYDGGGEEAFMERHLLRRIGAVTPVLDMDGSIHHWKVSVD